MGFDDRLPGFARQRETGRNGGRFGLGPESAQIICAANPVIQTFKENPGIQRAAG